jgi:predicted CXXCH cytochrome family protein
MWFEKLKMLQFGLASCVFVVWAMSAESLFAESAQPQQMDSFLDCHREASEPTLSEPVRQAQDDVHSSRGFSCVNCHGGDPTQSDAKRAMDPTKGFIGTPDPSRMPSFCGKCHSNAEVMKKYNPSMRIDQTTEYSTSVHGKLAVKGDKNVATCVSCHGVHGIRRISDPNSPVYPTNVAETCGRCHSNAEYMSRYSIATDQVEKYRKSVHADALLTKQDLSAPTCNDCHGNHGAAPPGVTSIGNVCGVCHSRQSDLFQKSPHQAAFDAFGIGECLACHNNHDVTHPTDQMLGVGPEATCVKCHNQGEAGFDAARIMRQDIEELSSNLQDARALLDRAAKAGMEVSRPKFDLTAAQSTLVDARVVIHAFSPDELTKVTKLGVDVAMKAHRSGQQALEDLQFRRKGLAVSLILILIAIMSIYFKLRQIESRTRARTY